MRKNRFAQVIRKVTLAPVLACITLFVIHFGRAEVFQSVFHFIYSILFLTIFPIMAYPLQKYIPKYRDQGREGQRQLAMLFAFLGYLCECAVNMVLPVSNELRLIGWTYLFSSIILLAMNLLCHIKLSGHAAGACAAVLFPVWLGIYWAAIPAVIVLAFVYLASVQMRRHSFLQLLGGNISSYFDYCPHLHFEWLILRIDELRA